MLSLCYTISVFLFLSLFLRLSTILSVFHSSFLSLSLSLFLSSSFYSSWTRRTINRIATFLQHHHTPTCTDIRITFDNTVLPLFLHPSVSPLDSFSPSLFLSLFFSIASFVILSVTTTTTTTSPVIRQISSLQHVASTRDLLCHSLLFFFFFERAVYESQF